MNDYDYDEDYENGLDAAENCVAQSRKPVRDLTNHMWQPSKWLFPRSPKDERRRKMNVLLLTLFGGVAVGGIVVAFIFMLNQRR